MKNYDAFLHQQVQNLKDEGRYRVFAQIARQSGEFPYAFHHQAQQRIVVWCSNDYLSMGQNPFVLSAMQKAVAQYGAGAGGTRNISGTTDLHVQLEAELADWHGKDAALLFTSGYVCNEAVLSTLGANLPDCVIFSDAKNHASIIQGIRHAKVHKEIFRHNDVEHLSQLLQRYPKSQNKIIVFESVYSMDGSIAPVQEIVQLAKQHNALTYIDEVHGVGLYGERGAGIVEHLGLSGQIDIVQGTFGKSIGVIGGYIAASAAVVDFIRSCAAGFIFTTSLPPVIVAGALASVRYLKTHPADRALMHLRVQQLKQGLHRAGIPFMDEPGHIVPVMVGDAHLCKMLTDRLLTDFQIYVQPINYPTVPKGTERMRLTPSPRHSLEMINHLCAALASIWHDLKLQKAA